MKKRLLGLLLALVMLVGMIPATTLTASAASAHSILVDGVYMSDGTYLAIGASNTTTSKPSGGYAYWKDDVLTLNNFEIYGAGLISCETSFTLYLEGTNTITRPKAFAESKTGAINCTAGSLTIDGDGVLDVTNYGDGIYTAGDLVINRGILRIEGQRFFVSSTGTDKGGTSLFIDGALYINGGYVYAGGVDCDPCSADAVHFNGGISHFLPGHKRGTWLTSEGKIYETGNPVYLVRDSNSSILEQLSLSDMRSECAPDYFNSKTGVDEIIVINEIEFVDQFPEMPAGKTTHNLGKVSSSEYVMTFGSQDTPSSIGVGGYKVIEKLIVYDRDNNGEIVDTVTNNPKLTGTGISYSLKNLPSGNYRIRESIILYDKDGKALYGNNNDFTIDWQPISDIEYFIAKSTEPIAGTLNNTPPTITFDPEYHCKVSDYMTGYWMYWENAGYKKKMEDNTKFQVDEDYYYVVAVETTDGYTFPADGGEVTGIVMCDGAIYAVQTDRVAGRDDVVIMTIWYSPCTYGAPLEFSEQTPVAEFTNSLYEMEGILGQEYLFRFNHKPLTDAQKAKGFSVERTLTVFEGSLSNVVYNVANDTGTQPLSYNLTIDQAQTYAVGMIITLKKDGTTLQSKGGVYLIKVVAGGTPVIFTADSTNAFGGTVTVDINAMAKKDANLKTALDNGTVKYQWYRGASQIPDANGQSYTFHADDVGKKIKVAVLYGNSGSISEPFTVTGTAPAFTTQPTGGDVAPGANLTVSWALSFTPTKIVVDKYNFAGLASEYTALSGTATSTELPANEYGYVIKAYYNDTDYIESNKFTVKEKEAPSFLLGDVDGDGNITSTDARLTLQFYAGKIKEESLNTAVADVDSDGQITSTDARLILQYYAGKIEKFPAT